MLDITKLLDSIKSSPYEEVIIYAPHTGVITFNTINVGDTVNINSGTWKEKPGTALATITRENNPKYIYTPRKGCISSINKELDNHFVQAGTPLLTIQHFLSKEEVLQTILQQVLHIFSAPEHAKYYFIPQIDTKIRTSGCQSVSVYDGMELFIISRMKREKPLYYSGPEGNIYTIYFQYNENISTGCPLIGICPKDQLQQVEEVVLKVQTEWQEHG